MSVFRFGGKLINNNVPTVSNVINLEVDVIDYTAVDLPVSGSVVKFTNTEMTNGVVLPSPVGKTGYEISFSKNGIEVEAIIISSEIKGNIINVSMGYSYYSVAGGIGIISGSDPIFSRDFITLKSDGVNWLAQCSAGWRAFTP